MKKLFLIVITLIGINCTAQKNLDSDFPPTTLKSKIKEAGTAWSKAIKQKDISLLAKLYDTHAHYLPNDADALHGQEAILGYWAASFDFMSDLQLNMETLEGTKQLLYETGSGLAFVLAEDGKTVELPFKYVNVWKLQDDGSYRVVIDTFNNPAAQ